MPEIAKFCWLLQKNVENESVMLQLLRLGFLFDLSDEAGRRALSALLRTCTYLAYRPVVSFSLTFSPKGELAIGCLSVPVIESIMKLLRHIHPREDEYLR